MPKTVDPLIKQARELSRWCLEDQARIAAIAAELYTAHGQPPPHPAPPAAGKVVVKRKGRKPGSKNKKKELDETFPKITSTDSGAGQ